MKSLNPLISMMTTSSSHNSSSSRRSNVKIKDETKQEDDNDWISFSVDSSWEKEVSCINFDAKTSIDSDNNNYCLNSMTSEDSNDSMSSTRRSESSICESMMQLPSLGEDEERHGGDECNGCVFLLEL
jgi:hypothetical protein